jgi:hypothetical protein
MLAVFGAGLAFTAVLGVLNWSVASNVSVLYLPAFTAFMVVGALVVARRPANAIGWLFSAIALLALGATLAGEYVQYAYVTRPGSLPFAVGAVWYLGWAAFSRVWPHLHLHAAVVSHRSAAIAPLATHRLAGRGGDGGVHRAGRPPTDAIAGR